MKLSDFYLAENFYLKLIEFLALYNIKTDELYCLDERAFNFLSKLAIRDLSSLKSFDKEKDEKIRDLLEVAISEGIVTKKPTARLLPKIRQSPIPSLRYLELQITKRCNLRCKHCFVGECLNVDLSVEETKKILREFEDMQGLRVLITGGEPLLHPHFDRINAFLKELAIRKVLFTNGLLLTDKWLKKLNVHEIQISLDGLKNGHESLRGKGTFEKTLSAIKSSIDFGFEVSVATVIHKNNIDEFNKLEELLKSLNIRDWTVDALTITGNLELNTDLWVHPSVAGKIMRRYGFSREEHPRAEGYACGAHLLSVSADGKAAYCSFFESSPLGNINEGLEKLWARKKHFLLQNLECINLNCPYIQECIGGCRYRAQKISGKEGSPDLFKCYQFERLQS